jgi:hypothetical protein
LFNELIALKRMPELGGGDAKLVRLPRGPLPNAAVVRRDGVVLWAVTRN